MSILSLVNLEYLILAVINLFFRLVLQVRKRCCLMEQVKSRSTVLQITMGFQSKDIKAALATNALSIFIVWTITRTKERVRLLRVDFTWIIQCYLRTVFKARSVPMKSNDVLEASMQFNCQRFNPASMAARRMTAWPMAVEFTTISLPLTNKTAQWYLNWCHGKRVTSEWWTWTMTDSQADCQISLLTMSSALRRVRKYCSRKIKLPNSQEHITINNPQWRSSYSIMSRHRRILDLGKTLRHFEATEDRMVPRQLQPFLMSQARMCRRTMASTNQQIFWRRTKE